MTSLTGPEMSGNCRLWAPRLISATVVCIISTYKLIFIAALESFTVNTKMWVGDFKYGIFDNKIFTPPQLPPQIPKFCITLKQRLVCFLKIRCSSTHRSTCGIKWIENVGARNPVAGSDNILQKCRFLPYLAFRQFWDPLLISATVKVCDFKFGTQLGFDK